jgi:branched-chain amino acid transport system substrate-binding protein
MNLVAGKKYRGGLMTKSVLGGLALGVAFFSSGAHGQEILKIGVLASLSGAGASWGLAMKGAAELAADDVNKSGGLDVSGKKYQIKIIAYDDQYKSSEAISAINRLISDDGVKYVVGPGGSAAAVAIMPITTSNKVITMTLAYSEKVTTSNTPYSFRSVIPTAIFAKPQIAWVVGKLGVKSIAGLFPNDESGQQAAKDIEIAYEAEGGKFVSKEFFDRDRGDFTPLLSRILASGADAIELDGNSPQTAGLIVKQARELGWDKAIIRTGGDATDDIIAIAGQQFAEGTYVHLPVDENKPETKVYADRWAAGYKTKMNGFSPFFYANLQMLFQAMKTANTVEDSTKVRDAMMALKDFPSSLGPVSWTGKDIFGIDHQLDAPFYIGQIKDGKSKIVARCTSKTCE